MSGLNLKQSPKLVQQHKLILTQELQLFLKLIQMNTLELKDYLEEQLLENPTLEESQEKSENDTEEKTEEDIDSMLADTLKSQNNSDDFPHSKDVFAEADDNNPWENLLTKADSLLEHLRWQLKMSDFSEKEKEIGSSIIGNINEDGYLETEINDIAANLAETKGNVSYQAGHNVTQDEVKNVLKKIQTNFDPVGIGARSLTECLKMQAYDLGYTDNCPIVKVIENHLEALGDNDYEIISKNLEINIEEIKEIEHIISSFEPKPGRPYYTRDTDKYITPDFYIYRVGNEFQIQPNKSFPRIRISMYYRNLIRKHKTLNDETKIYLKEKIESAKRILKCLEERETTVRKVMNEIVRVQRDFFEYGKDYIKPLRLKDVAEVVGVHESTVSRITSKRYVQCPQGVIELKSLFSRGVETNGGKQMSLERVKSMIKEIVENESDSCPFSDEDISKILGRKNVKVARRTVAKYRKLLGIPTSSKRLIKE